MICALCGRPIAWDACPRAGLRHQADLQADRHQGWIHVAVIPGPYPDSKVAIVDTTADHQATPWIRQPRLFAEATAEAVIETGAGRYVLVGQLKEAP